MLPSPLQVMNGAILQQVFVVEFVIQSQMCDDCHRVEAKDFWKAVVQVRQKAGVCGPLWVVFMCRVLCLASVFVF